MKSKFILNSVILILSICCGLVVAELSSIYIYKAYFEQTEDINPDRWQFRFSNPLPYKDREIYNQDFLNESIACVRDLQDRPGGYYIQGDFRGNYINVIDGIRRTTGNRPNYANSLFLFGGSTVFGQEVKDEHTIASYLQDLTNANDYEFNVINLGTVSYTSPQQLRRLENTTIKPGDIVVFYDGWNDVAYPVERGMRNGWSPGNDHDSEFQPVKLLDFHNRIRKLSFFEKQIIFIYLKTSNLGYQPYFIKILYNNLYAGQYIGFGQSVDDARMRVSNMAEKYKENITEAHAYTQKYQGRFFHFLQPSAFSSTERSKYLNKIIATDVARFHATLDIHEMGLIAQQKVVNELRGKGIESYDITDAFNALPANEEVFLDTVHVNHVGNRIIATRIFSVLFSEK